MVVEVARYAAVARSVGACPCDGSKADRLRKNRSEATSSGIMVGRAYSVRTT